MDRQEVAQLVDALDHPDSGFQRDIMDQLLAEGSSILDALVANLHTAPPRARNCVVRVLGELGDPDAILPLMRFVFDRKGSIADGDARGLAMKALVDIADETLPATKMFQFLLDVYQDDDPFVRGYALALLGRFGDRRALPLVQEALVDEADFVAERARDAVKSLEQKIAVGPEADVDDEELLRSIRGKQGGERKYYLNELRSRDNAFELSERLVAEGGRGVIAGLEFMLECEDSRARGVARRHAMSTDKVDELAICLRILNQFMHADASNDELAIIRGALYHADSFVRLAALEGAGRSGDATLIERAVDATRDADMDRRHAAARGLSYGLSPAYRKVLPDLMQAFELANARRLAVVTDDTVRIEAFIVRAIRRIVEEGGFGTTQAQEVALSALEGAIAHMPLVVTALELLDLTTPAEGYPADRRWDEELSRNLVELLHHHDDEIRDRVLSLLIRGAPTTRSMVDGLERIMFDHGADIAGKVVPLLETVGDERAKKLLTDLTDEKDDGVRLAAAAALKRLRNSDEVIDAEFETAQYARGGPAMQTSDEPREVVAAEFEDDEF